MMVNFILWEEEPSLAAPSISTGIKSKRKGGRSETTWKSVLFERNYKWKENTRTGVVFMLSLWGRLENKWDKKRKLLKIYICYAVSCSHKAHLKSSKCYKLLLKSSILYADLLLNAWLYLEKDHELSFNFYTYNECIPMSFLHKNTFLIKSS